VTRRGLVVVVSGPSGVGKGTVHARVREELDDAWLSVSATTRPARGDERDGVEYRFVTPDEFEALASSGALLEHAGYAGHRYGTPRGPVEQAVAAGRVAILDIEVQGALQVKSAMPDALLVFLEPPSMAELERRLRTRGTEDEAAIDRRLARAREELALAHQFDAVVVNDDLERCVAEVLARIRDRRRAG
jgi:guanylate kinase